VSVKAKIKTLLSDLIHTVPEKNNHTAHKEIQKISRPIYRQHCEHRKAPVFNLLRGRFWG